MNYFADYNKSIYEKNITILIEKIKCDLNIDQNKLFHYKIFTKLFVMYFEFDDKRIPTFIFDTFMMAIREHNQYFVRTYETCMLSIVEIAKIIQIAIFLSKKYGFHKKYALVFSIGLVYSTFIFENNGIYLTIRQIYDIIPKGNYKPTFRSFLQDFFTIGTSKEVSCLLYYYNC